MGRCQQIVQDKNLMLVESSCHSEQPAVTAEHQKGSGAGEGDAFQERKADRRSKNWP